MRSLNESPMRVPARSRSAFRSPIRSWTGTRSRASQRALDLGDTDERSQGERRRSTSIFDRSDDVLQPRRPAQTTNGFARAQSTPVSSAPLVPDLPLDELDGWGDAADEAGVAPSFSRRRRRPTTGFGRHLRAIARVRLRRVVARCDGRSSPPPRTRDGTTAQGDSRQA